MVSTNTTTVDFNASGFSVVDNFVDQNAGGISSQNDKNGDDSKKHLTTTSSTSRSQLVPSKTSGRKGVGAAVDQMSNPRDGVASKAAIAQKILRVGAKKRRKGMNMDDDDDEDNDAGMHADTPRDDDSDEESGSECGRTEITDDTDKQQLVKESGQPRVDATTKPKKKKKGRKERKIQESNQLLDGLIAKADHEASEASKGSTGKDANISNSNDDDDDDVCRQAKDQDADEQNEAKAKQQRARRKVRSRQKNVRKDTRLEKPAHLIPGQTRHYQGIPLTTETREKLHLPPPSSRTRKEASTAKRTAQDNHDHFNAATSYVKDSISQQPLAVDYLMSDDNENGMSEAVIAPNTATMCGDRSDVKTKKESKTKPPKKGRQRPSKYKNLR